MKPLSWEPHESYGVEMWVARPETGRTYVVASFKGESAWTAFVTIGTARRRRRQITDEDASLKAAKRACELHWSGIPQRKTMPRDARVWSFQKYCQHERRK